ncbi:5,6-dimethylbenzimidazole synthase [Azorhizobium doebereinerae]|uniref:5,6-dimethylbenzimidazole synthase n=1 Tax=Azorhizobium doebereinerae TaxID=281091 RepID=UPI0004062630|nr:5,6-dimethylbenzimidazole synthase [Azorhizobium doebereinerae]
MSAPRFSPAFREQLQALFAWRRDVRAFRTDPLPAGLLDELVATACLAPSVGLSQPWRFVEVTEPGRRAAIRANFEAANAAALAAQAHHRQAAYARLKLAGLDEAPCHLAVFADAGTTQGHGLGRRTMPEAVDYSAVLAIHTLWLAARAADVGVGWVSILDPAGVAAALDVPESWHFVGYLCIGYPQAEQETPTLETAGWEHRRPAGSFLLRR